MRASSPSPRRCCNAVLAMWSAIRAFLISHLMDVLADAQDILGDLGVHFERGEWPAKRLQRQRLRPPCIIPSGERPPSSRPSAPTSPRTRSPTSLPGGVTGGALIIVGEDYGEGSSIMQERSHAFAMKSQVWLLDPRPNLPSIVKAVEDGFELSEASNTPVMLEVRIRCCHVHGKFTAKDNKRPAMTVADALAVAAPRHRPHRAAAGLVPAREGESREALAGRGRLHPARARSTSSSGPTTARSASSCRAACTTPSSARCSASA